MVTPDATVTVLIVGIRSQSMPSSRSASPVANEDANVTWSMRRLLGSSIMASSSRLKMGKRTRGSRLTGLQKPLGALPPALD